MLDGWSSLAVAAAIARAAGLLAIAVGCSLEFRTCAQVARLRRRQRNALRELLGGRRGWHKHGLRHGLRIRIRQHQPVGLRRNVVRQAAAEHGKRAAHIKHGIVDQRDIARELAVECCGLVAERCSKFLLRSDGKLAAGRGELIACGRKLVVRGRDQRIRVAYGNLLRRDRCSRRRRSVDVRDHGPAAGARDPDQRGAADQIL